MAHEKDERSTLELLAELETEIHRFRKKAKRVTRDLLKAQRQIAKIEKQAVEAVAPRDTVAPGAVVDTPVKPQPLGESVSVTKVPKRRALGRGLAQIRGVV